MVQILFACWDRSLFKHNSYIEVAWAASNSRFQLRRALTCRVALMMSIESFWWTLRSVPTSRSIWRRQTEIKMTWRAQGLRPHKWGASWPSRTWRLWRPVAWLSKKGELLQTQSSYFLRFLHEMLHRGLKKAWLEDFYSFVESQGGTTSEVMGHILKMEASVRSVFTCWSKFDFRTLDQLICFGRKTVL